MKRKIFIAFLGVEAVACVLYCVLQASFAGVFSAALAFPFEQIGLGLRSLSLSGGAGNVAALVIYFAISLAPVFALLVLRKRRRLYAEDWLLALLSAVLFAVLYVMINPYLIDTLLPVETAGQTAGQAAVQTVGASGQAAVQSAGQTVTQAAGQAIGTTGQSVTQATGQAIGTTGQSVTQAAGQAIGATGQSATQAAGQSAWQSLGKAVLGGMAYSVICGYIILRILRLFNEGGTDKLARYMSVMLGLLNIIFVYLVFGYCFSALLDSITALRAGNAGNEHLLGATYVFLVFQFVVNALPYIMNVLIVFAAQRLLREMRADRYSAGSLAAAGRTSRLCVAALVATVLANIGFNVLQLLFARSLMTINSSVQIPLFSIAFVLAALLFTRLAAENKQLKDDIDLFV